MSKYLLPLTCVFFLLLSFLVPWQSAARKSAPITDSQTEEIDRALFVGTLDADQYRFEKSAATLQAFDSLIAKAQSEGPVRVIVGFRVTNFQPEGKLAGSRAIALQRAAIGQVQSDVMDRLSALNVSSLHNFTYIPFTAMTVDEKGLEQLKISNEVTSIEEDIPLELTLAESVPLIGAPAAWSAGYTGSGQTVAILDTGVDKTHSFLSGKVVSEACYSTNSSNPLSSTVCPGGVTSSTSPGSGINCDPSINGCVHGTHVAGIAAGKGSSFSGVAKDANIIAVQVFSRFDSPTECKGSPPCVKSNPTDQIRGLERVFALRSTYNIAAVNISIGGRRFFTTCDSDNPSYKAAIDNLRSVGIATVIASGNENYKDSMASPACISSAISVGATGDGSGGTTADRVASFSNSASFLSLLAPGDEMCSSVPSGFFSNARYCLLTFGGDFALLSGTSMAAPHVAGAWAVLKSKKPTATVDEVFAALRDTGLPVTDVNGITKPRIKVDAAINAIGGGNNCSTTPIGFGQSLAGSLITTDCRYPWEVVGILMRTRLMEPLGSR